MFRLSLWWLALPIWEVTFLTSHLAIGPRDRGIKQIRPIESVTKPGVRSNAPPTISIIPSINSVSGISLSRIFCLSRERVASPSCLSSIVPTVAVKTTRTTVEKAPITFPTLMRMNISRSGTKMKIVRIFRMSMIWSESVSLLCNFFL